LYNFLTGCSIASEVPIDFSLAICWRVLCNCLFTTLLIKEFDELRGLISFVDLVNF
jgi:hypothetical protein